MHDADRRLAAILSADVAGYSRLMADDEDATVRTLRAWREQVSSLITEHRGALADFTGDNFLAEFPAARDAVECALEIQRVIEARNSALPEARRMRFRIGAHLGDVRHEDGRSFGDGVNVAARLQPLAEPGGLCISGALAEMVRGKVELALEDLGEQELKNIPNAVRAFRVRTAHSDASQPAANTPAPPRSRVPVAVALGVVLTAVVGAAYFAMRPSEVSSENAAAPTTPAALPPIRSLAVLPLANLSGDPAQEYFADGMTETLIAELAKLPGVRIISRTSVMQFKGTKTALPEIAKQLNVDAVIEGSVLRAENQVRITAQLIDARSDQHVWAEQYDRELARVFEIQSEVARSVAGEIALALTPEQAARLKAPKPVDPRAQEAYFRGLSQRDLSGDWVSAQASFEESVRLAPDFAPAWSALSIWYSASCYLGCKDVPAVANRAREAAARALQLDPDLGDAHAAAAMVDTYFDWDWPAAERGFRRAQELGSSTDRFGRGALLSLLLLDTGRRDEALVEFERWSREAPADLAARALRIDFLIHFGNYEEALREANLALQANRTASQLHIVRGDVLDLLGRYEEAVDSYKAALAAIAPSTNEAIRAEEASDLEALERGFKSEGVPGYFRAAELRQVRRGEWTNAAGSSAMRGDIDGAFAHLDRALEARDPLLRRLITSPWLRPLHSDPRFADLARRMNLPLPKP